MTRSNQFDYGKYQLAVAIYNYAERLVTTPDDDRNIQYCKIEAAKALEVCRTDKVNWIPKSEICKGKKLAGRIQVTVETYPDTSYGWSLYPDSANKISQYLESMWKKYIHGLSIETILDPSLSI